MEGSAKPRPCISVNDVVMFYTDKEGNLKWL